MTTYTVSPDLLEILRCPHCVSGETRMPGADPGQLDLVRDGTWLVSTQCNRKYPIKEGIPVMLIEEGNKWIETPVEALPTPGPLVDPSEVAIPDTPFTTAESSGPDPRLFMIGALIGVVGIVIFILLLRRRA